MPSRIEDYALIGDCHTAALVARSGSIDWLCFPRFDSGDCFAALLGSEEHGHWSINPAEEIRRIRRGYRNGTLVLETNYETADGAATVIDCMPPRSKEADLVRVVAGTRGQVRMRMELVVRFDYGSIVPWARRTANGMARRSRHAKPAIRRLSAQRELQDRSRIYNLRRPARTICADVASVT